MKTRRFCPKCERQLKKSKTQGYAFQCTHCDEDFYRFEVLTKNHLLILKDYCSEINRRMKGLSAIFNVQTLVLEISVPEKTLLNVKIGSLSEASDYWSAIFYKKIALDINLYIEDNIDGKCSLYGYIIINNNTDHTLDYKIPLKIIHENKTQKNMEPKKFNKITAFDFFMVNGIKALRTIDRIDRNSIPEGLFAYDIRMDDEARDRDEDIFITIEKSVKSDHDSTIITNEELPLNQDGCVDIEEIDYEDEIEEKDDWRLYYCNEKGVKVIQKGHADAIHILVARDLGLEVSHVEMAEQYLKTGSMEPILIGGFSTAATNAHNLIAEKGLHEKANKLAKKYL